MQIQKGRKNIGVWSIAASLVVAIAVGGPWPVLAEETTETTSTGNRVFFRGGAGGLTSDRAGELITDVHTGGNEGFLGVR